MIWLFVYRLSLILGLSLVFSYSQALPWLASHGNLNAARHLLALQTLSVLLSGVLLILHWPKQEHQIELAIFFDIVLYTLLMHVSGGVDTGLGLILAIVVAAGAMMMQGRLSLLFASLATLAVIAHQYYVELYFDSSVGTYTQAGLLGVTYFAVALLAHVLSHRLRETEHLAARRKVDIADLSKLNDYIIQSMSIGVLAIDGARKLLLINNAARRLLNAPLAHAGDNLCLIAPTLEQWLQQQIQNRPHVRHDIILFGEQEVSPSLHLLGEFRDNGALIFLHDQRELARQAQDIKLASLGRLTASIAHNIRNPLSSVTHASQLLAESQRLDQEDRYLLTIIERNALRIDETVTSVLELSRRDQPHPHILKLADWLTEFCDEYCRNHYLQETIISCCLTEQMQDHYIQVDPRHFRQILRNLCDNAIQHGRLDNDQLPNIIFDIHFLDTCDELHVTITDTGTGIAAEHVRSLFDPFFTTSRTGTGLGLYAARELAEANGIRLEYVEDYQSGTRFRLIIAALDPVTITQPAPNLAGQSL
jgi:two-component system sensor histidine kinase PilS (NtrC family)